jgi:uncharacterized protein
MKLVHSFTVHTPVDDAWRALTDLGTIAACLPGAGRDALEVKAGAVIAEFAGTARFTSTDDHEHTAVLEAEGKDTRAPGTAAATVTASLRPDGSTTLVTLDADVTITGALAQFGGAVLKDVTTRLLDQFAAALDARLAPAPRGLARDADSDHWPEETDDDALDLLALAGETVAKRVLPIVAGLLVAGFVIAWATRLRRR